MRMGAANTNPTGNRKILWLSRPFWALIAADLASAALSFVLGFLLRDFFPGSLDYSAYLALAPALALFPLLYAAFRLYPGAWMHPAEELKLLARAISFSFCLLAACFFLLKSADSFSRGFFFMAWLCALVLTPLFRHATRRFCGRFSWWRTPVILIGKADSARSIRRQLEKRPRLGLFPVAAIQLTNPAAESPEATPECAQYPMPEDDGASRDLFALLAGRHPGAVVFVLLDGLSSEFRDKLLLLAGEHFQHLFLAPGDRWDYGVPDQVLEMDEAFVLTMRRNLNDKRRLRLKRACDLFLGTGFALAALPLFLILALCIRLDSPGAAIFRHRRIGRGGKPFDLFKFRTMIKDSDSLLGEYLKTHPESAEEWASSQKLRQDPRITRLGRFLRRTSLDELPQILNVLQGEMSLVGPRPIVQEEVQRYGEIFSLYSLVLPGVTGLWQVSGRSDCAYEDRVRLDRSYVVHWSVWLDIYILIKTIPEIFRMRGAY
ncbi:MAG: undecaprenyl-phosphate galactose phosphotransferase WbaP [Deltaproteobacteria bacterium]|jgi:Undecaprenyl-phosphate galactose phosphotransferase WbaP|nr:undecaprenyl-phosphate galactose phosphotransferase WbaP [Deltaproteobacteria bacterium]